MPHGGGAVAAAGGDWRGERDSAAGIQPEDGGTLRCPGVGGAPGRCDGAADKLALLPSGRRRQGAAGRRTGWANCWAGQSPSGPPKSPVTANSGLDSSTPGAAPQQNLKVGAPGPGQKVFIVTNRHKNGWKGPESVVSAIVPPRRLPGEESKARPKRRRRQRPQPGRRRPRKPRPRPILHCAALCTRGVHRMHEAGTAVLSVGIR